jgi:asparagine synthetase B (glutamine-hydrolysing)
MQVMTRQFKIGHPKVTEYAGRYWKQLIDICHSQLKYLEGTPIVMLSGGVDSLFCAALAKTIHGDIETLTIRGAKHDDTVLAKKTAERLGVENTMVMVTINDIMENIDLAKNHNVHTVYELQWIITHRLVFQQFDISGKDIYQGDYADILLGSHTSFVYREVNSLVDELNVTKDEARTILKQRLYKKFQETKYKATEEHKHGGRGTGQRFFSLSKSLGANPVQPFKDKGLKWVNDLPYSVSRPDKKLLPREAIRYGGFSASTKVAKRINMQAGSGIYESLKERLVKDTGASSPNMAVRILLNEKDG